MIILFWEMKNWFWLAEVKMNPFLPILGWLRIVETQIRSIYFAYNVD